MDSLPFDPRLAYKYLPLDGYEIRLLQIVKSPLNDDILGYSIIHTEIHSAPPYETVSYVWGETTPSSTITLLNGSVLAVTTSLSRSLPRIARLCATGFLWIDQLTINQRNTHERSAQVKIMGEIYRRCSRCLIWLGTDPRIADIDEELDWNRKVGEAVKDFFDSFPDDYSGTEARRTSSIEERRTSSPSFSRRSNAARRPSLVNDHLLWFLEHPWFCRTWVYQEFVLAPQATFLIGEFELPRDEIVRVFKSGWSRGAAWFDTFDQSLNTTSTTQATLFHQAPAVNFLLAAVEIHFIMPALQEASKDLRYASNHDWHGDGFVNYESLAYSKTLENMGASQAQDDRDHVYAFVGLAPCLLKHMRVDYSLSVEETFAAMMKALVRESRSLDFFCNLPCENDISKSKLRLPSWVPNWTFCADNVPILGHDNHFNACGEGFGLPFINKCKHNNTDPPPPDAAAWNELQVAGRIIDAVSFILRPYSPYQVNHARDIKFETHKGFLPWEMSTLDILMAEINERGVNANEHISRKSLLRTLLMDGVQWSTIDALNSGEDLYRKDIVTIDLPHRVKAKAILTELTEQKTPDYDNLSHGADRYLLHELSKVQFRRRVAYCRNGRLALAPDLVEKDDQIVILHGSRTPVVVRLRPDKKYVVVGQCYYDGAMYGEMADLDDDAADIFTLV